jgi:SpoIID/LytB domain protein
MMPGSTLKAFTALAALRAGLLDNDSRTVCPGRFSGLSLSLPCVHENHLPPFNPAQAIAYSCNYYFGTLGQRLNRDQLVETLRPFGLGQPSGVSDNDEAAGTLRPCETGNSARVRGESNHAALQSDCDARSALGESDHIQVTPIQLLNAYVALVNGGHLWQPRVARAAEFASVEHNSVSIAAAHRTIITEGMRGAIRYGTARSAHLDSLPLSILGKTGTSMPPKGYRTNGWFVGFASRGKPVSNSSEPEPGEIELAVLVLLTRSHGSDAAATSRRIFETYANAISRSPSTSSVDSTLPTTEPKSEFGNHQSSIRIHLVTENVTQELPLEDYVLGVMRAEGSMETEPEALRALAIAIRTYAVSNRGRHQKDGYDFCSTTHCQRFVTGNSSRAIVDAVRATEAQVLTGDHGQPIEAYFSASCGGETANVGSLWGTTPPAYLRGVHDEYCTTGPHATWTDSISRADLLRALQSDTRTDVGSRLDNVVIAKRDDTGRAEFIGIEGERRKTIRGWDFKIIVGRVLGWNLLKSSRFEVARTGSGFVFRGHGFGHGLGLCQEGAHVMAQRGLSYQKILEKYFLGTSLKRDTGFKRDAAFERDAETGREGKRDTEIRGRGEGEIASLSRHWRADILLTSPDLRVATSPRLRVSLSTSPRFRVSLSTSPRLRVVASSPRVLTISSEHFRVTYPADVDRRDADAVLNTLETARADFLHRAASASTSVHVPTLEIRLNESTGDFTSRSGQPWWAAAATKGNRIELQPVGLLKRRGVLTSTLRHELAHAVFDVLSHDRAPRWIEEGFAIYLAGEGQMISRYARRRALSLDELEQRLERPTSQIDMRANYADAYAKVVEMIRVGGEASVWKKLATS